MQQNYATIQFWNPGDVFGDDSRLFEPGDKEVRPASERAGSSGMPPVTPPVAPPVNQYVRRLLELLKKRGALGNADIRDAFELKDRRRLRETYVVPALADDLIEMTIPDKPNSRLQKYRLTAKGRALLEDA